MYRMNAYKLKNTRLRAGLSLTDVAIFAGVTKNYISMLEHEKFPISRVSMGVMEKIRYAISRPEQTKAFRAKYKKELKEKKLREQKQQQQQDCNDKKEMLDHTDR